MVANYTCTFELFLLSLIISATTSSVHSFSMTWKDTWTDILNGGPKRWKVDDLEAKKIALAHITQHSSSVEGRPLRILCPLAGDDPFVHYAWSQGHDVTAIDIVPGALKEIRSQFGEMEDWTSDETLKSQEVWKHKSGMATLYCGDVFMKRPELLKSFDAIYDKDSFGALPREMRRPFCEILSEFVNDGGTLYIEVKNKENESERKNGPPFHVEKSDLMEHFASTFEHVSNLGEVYALPMAGLKQTGHVLRRMMRR